MSDVNEVVKHLHLKDIHPFPDHPFEVKDDEYMRETLKSVKEYGVLCIRLLKRSFRTN